MRISVRECLPVLLFLTPFILYGCEADLGSRTSPLSAGDNESVVVFGIYVGAYQIGSAGVERSLTLHAESCGAVITGSTTGMYDEEIILQGALVGTVLYLEGGSEAPDGDGYTLVLTGYVPSGLKEGEAPTLVSGFWEGSGESGTWVAERDNVSSEGDFCDPEAPSDEAGR